VLFRLGEGEFHVRCKSLVVSEMMIRGEETYDSFGINLVKMRQAVRDSRRSAVVMRLDQQAFTRDAGQLIGVKALVSLRQYQERLAIRDHPGYTTPCLVQ